MTIKTKEMPKKGQYATAKEWEEHFTFDGEGYISGVKKEELFEMKEEINKIVKTKEDLEREVMKLYPNLKYYNNFTTGFSDGWIVKDLFSYVHNLYADNAKRYKFYYFPKKHHKFSILDKFNRTENPEIILKLIKSIKDK